MTGTVFKYTNNSSELSRKKRMAWLGNTIIEVAQVGHANVDPIGVEGWQVFGLVTQSSPARNVEYVDLRTGSPETSKGNLIVGDSLEFGITFSHPTLMGFRLSQANTYAHSVNYASDGQTTVDSNATNTSATLTSGTGFAVGDMFEVDLTSTSYGGFKEVGFITSVSSADVTFTRLSQVPSATATFKKIKGWGTSNTASTTGIKFYIGGVEVPSYQMRRLTYNSNNRSLFVEHYPEVEILNPVPLSLDDSKNLITSGFTARVISQNTDITDYDGVTLPSANYFGNQYILPYES